MKKTKAIIDRFEGDIAVISADSAVFDIPKTILPEDAKEGDVVYITTTNDEEKTKSREEAAKALLNETLREK
jgi:glutamine phosphoribosylpyrophosphate amidotransferase